MSYMDGFVIAVPRANKQAFIEHAKLGDSVFMDLGALRVVECWGDDVPKGQVTDFFKGSTPRTTRPSSCPGSNGPTNRRVTPPTRR